MRAPRASARHGCAPGRETEVGKAGLFVVTDVVLDPRAGAMAAFEHRDVAVGLVGEVQYSTGAYIVHGRSSRRSFRAASRS